jgi:hypothetical protein
MNDIFELWSLPWHALQRSLAETFGAEANVNSAAGGKPSNAHSVPAAASSWLVRARSGAMQAASAGQ